MAIITFKNVGQGDSIIFEWEDDNQKKKIGIVDSNIYDQSNPTLNHFIASELDEIEFIILSHPHYDHFSGMNQILNYCKENNKIIKLFYHTSIVTPEHFKAANKTTKITNELIELFRNISKLRKENIIERLNQVNDSTIINLTSKLNLRFLAPISIEIENYISKVKIFQDEEVASNPNANWLSTVLELYTSESYIIFTSDCTKETLKRIGIEKTKLKDENKVFLMGQVPHHGSEKNHYKEFWVRRNRTNIVPAVASVGINGYGHPSKDVINSFEKELKLYNFKATNTITTRPNGFIENTNTISLLLDTISKRVEEFEPNLISGSDLKFEYKDNEIYEL